MCFCPTGQSAQASQHLNGHLRSDFFAVLGPLPGPVRSDLTQSGRFRLGQSIHQTGGEREDNTSVIVLASDNSRFAGLQELLSRRSPRPSCCSPSAQAWPPAL